MLFLALLAYLSSYLKLPQAQELPSPSYYVLLILAKLSLSLGPFLVLFPLIPDTSACFLPYIFNKPSLELYLGVVMSLVHTAPSWCHLSEGCMVLGGGRALEKVGHWRFLNCPSPLLLTLPPNYCSK